MRIKTIAIIGAGTPGRAIAYASTLGGFRTILEDVSDSVIAKALLWIHGSFDEGVKRGNIDPASREAALSLISTSHIVDEAIRDADLIIETVPDELEMKLELFTIFDKFAKPNAIFASNTSSLSISDLSDIVIARDRCVGMRFFDEASKTNRVEIVRTSHTSDETVTTCVEVARRMRKETVVVTEVPDAFPKMF
jgi:3-hydroxybutyryl-CoA dehydrogenase